MSSKKCSRHGGEGPRSDNCTTCNQLRQTWENEPFCSLTSGHPTPTNAQRSTQRAANPNS